MALISACRIAHPSVKCEKQGLCLLIALRVLFSLELLHVTERSPRHMLPGHH